MGNSYEGGTDAVPGSGWGGVPMIIRTMLRNEPDNLSHADLQMGPEWRQFSAMTQNGTPGRMGNRRLASGGG
jgi:hypothetical protein